MNWCIGLCIFTVACLPLQAVMAIGGQYDLVLHGGRVIDPASGLNAVRNVAIADGRIAEVSERQMHGDLVVDVGGLIVAPGFIDLHAHAQMPLGQHFAVYEGVTTALELEAGSYPVTALGTHEPFAIEVESRINFGASVSHIFIRDYLFEGDRAAQSVVHNALLKMPNNRSSVKAHLTTDQMQQLENHLNTGLDQGGLGIGISLDYMNEAVNRQELELVFEVAAARHAPIFVHVRRNGPAGDPSGLIEVLELAERSGAPLHVVHISASGINGTANFLRLVREARSRGVSVTMETYPYNTGGTPLTADVMDRDWQSIFGTTYEDLEMAGTGERLSRATFEKYRKTNPDAFLINYYNREEWTRPATVAEDVIIASDSLPMFNLQYKVHPMGIGSFARVLGRYVREEGALSLYDAITKMTLLPAQVLAGYSPNFTRKGHIGVGADADIAVFNPRDVIDNATYLEPYQESSGMVHVLVGGVFVLRDGQMQESAYPGQRLLANPM